MKTSFAKANAKQNRTKIEQAQEDAKGDQWTELLAPKPGTYRLAAHYQLPRGTGCPEDLRQAAGPLE